LNSGPSLSPPDPRSPAFRSKGWKKPATGLVMTFSKPRRFQTL
jgi:hypothetical protein